MEVRVRPTAHGHSRSDRHSGGSVPIWLNLRRRDGTRSCEEDHQVPHQLPTHREGARQEVSRRSQTRPAHQRPSGGCSEVSCGAL
eukprot:16435545-Heterocapsa_arctica.AAC.1